jgi:hypothetical protein
LTVDRLAVIYRDDDGELEGEECLVEVVVRVVVAVSKIVRRFTAGVVLVGELGLSSVEVGGLKDSSVVASLSDVDTLDVEVSTVS